MASILKPWFGSRHHRKTPKWDLGKPPKRAGRQKPAEPDVKPVWNLGDPPNQRRRVDWALLLLVVLVFVAGFVWIIPALGAVIF
jgi:hypothetical protein